MALARPTGVRRAIPIRPQRAADISTNRPLAQSRCSSADLRALAGWKTCYAIDSCSSISRAGQLERVFPSADGTALPPRAKIPFSYQVFRIQLVLRRAGGPDGREDRAIARQLFFLSTKERSGADTRI